MLPADQAKIRSFRVVPDMPAPLEPLLEMARNLWWTWHPEAVELFTRLDRDLWEETDHNPIKMLGTIDQRLLERVATDQSYLHALSLVHARFKAHSQRTSWFERQYLDICRGQGAHAGAPMRVAYFCAEFGITECLQIYSGGLGCLAGDHLKSASELGLPMCGVGLLYRCGYFHQHLNSDGWQQQTYPDLDFANQAVQRVLDPESGEQVRVRVQLPGREVVVGVWKATVGRVPLYLLDTNMPENARADRDITKTLYGGDVETRIQQEIVLGIGGVRALEAVGEKPTVFHLNEGHAAFISVERISRLREVHGASFEEAKETAAANNVFTTHTPVPAGIDRFAPDLVMRYLKPYLDRLGVNDEQFLSLGRSNPADGQEFFSMAVLALRCSQFANGVSRLHGHVSRDMWRELWPGVPAQEIPIGHVTNGVHPRSWISKSMGELFDRYVGPDWQLDPTDHHLWERVHDIPDEELWAHRQERRRSLIMWTRKRLRKQLSARGQTPAEIDKAVGALDPNILTIGFARRFATYKRGTLLMSDLDRLAVLLNNRERPFQLLIAGKAHPADGPGKELIQQLVKLSQSSDAFRRIVFIEDYDMEVGRRMVQGCDIWLNTPRRGLEASGTSGMKGAMNGVINVSILDGWWDEAFQPDLGFAIGRGETYDDQAQADAIESAALYDLFERQILPEFYDRTDGGPPRAWVQRMKHTIRELTPRFSSNRMVADYGEQYYLVAHGLGQSLQRDSAEQGKALSHHIRRLRDHWGGVGVREVITDASTSVPLRKAVRVRAVVDLGGLDPSEVRVQIYTGEVTSLGDLTDASSHDMRHAGDGADGAQMFDGEFHPGGSGHRGFAVRIVPRDERLIGTLLPGLITWDQGAPTKYVAEIERHGGAPTDTSRETATA